MAGSAPTMAQMSVGVAASEPQDPKKEYFDLLRLYVFDAALTNWSVCTDRDGCLEDAKRITEWLCASKVCEGLDKSKTVAECFEFPRQYSAEVKERIGTAACFLISTPSPLSRSQFLKHFSQENHATEEEIVMQGAYLMAQKNSAEACEDSIKKYVGEYGPKWNARWYRSMAGCRILAHKRSVAQEEGDFDIWYDVVQGSKKCSDIANNEMRDACNAKGAASPIPKPDYIK